MLGGDGLATAVTDIDEHMGRVAHEIEAARKQIDQAMRAVDEVKRNQAQQRDALANLSAQLDAAVRENLDGIADLKERVNKAQEAINVLEEKLRSSQEALTTVLAMQIEEKLRRERESEWARFVLRLFGMLREISDPAVRLVFASDAMSAIDRRRIQSSSFLGAADQAAIDETLYKIERVSRDVLEPARTEADAFLQLRALDQDAARLRSSWEDQTRKLSNDTASAESRVEEAKHLLIEAEAPEPQDSRLRRRSSRINFTALAVIVPLGALATAAMLDLRLAWGGLAAVPFAVLAWLRSDAHRQRVLVRRRERLTDTEQSLSSLRDLGPEIERHQKSELASIRTRWRATKLEMPLAADLDDPMAALIAAQSSIAQARQVWESAHSEVAVLTR